MPRVNRVLSYGHAQTQDDTSPMFHFTNSSQISLVTHRRRHSAATSSRPNFERNVMNPANLPFDSEAMLHGLRGWVECESPTWDANAVNRMLDLAAREMAIMGASVDRIAGRQGFGAASAPASRIQSKASPGS
jgi:hypothetical protein